MIKTFINKFWRTFLFWMLFFAIHRLIFILFNMKFSNGTPIGQLIWSFIIGLRLDSSFTGYIMLLIGVSLLPLLLLQKRINFRWFSGFNKVLIVILSSFLLGDTLLYSFWGKHMDSEAIGFLQTPDIVMASLHWYQPIVFIAATALISYGLIFIFKRLAGKFTSEQSNSWTKVAVQALCVLFISALMIAPIRGSVGVAPINTGVAYFSTFQYANHSALNPLWNLSYAMKKSDDTKVRYRFMDDSKANEIFNKLTKHSGEYEHFLTMKRPNVVVILLESFAAHVINNQDEGDRVTPNIDALLDESVLFTGIRAAANRSDKGLVASLAGYQVLPAYSIIRFPDKTNSLPFLPKKMKDNGYQDLMYMYGGDIKFKNMNSFVQQAGFEQVISIDDFPSEFQGEKWGVHDEYTFRRLAEEMKTSRSPYFKFMFTLSSHEPFDVPMERKFENNYHNSVAYTDQCIGEFFDTVKKNGQWDETLFILIADHAVSGPKHIPLDDVNYSRIPMIWTGGALAVKDTTISNIGSQTDMARTLLSQLDINADEFKFSKNILDEGVAKFAFHTIAPASISFFEEDRYQNYNVNINRFNHMDGVHDAIDSLKAKAYLQVISNDHQNR